MEAMALSKEQLLLLNNLIYEVNQDQINTGNRYSTVAELINDSRFRRLASGKETSGMSTSTDWKNIVQAVKSDPQLMNLKIRECHIDQAAGGGGGKSMVFTDESTKEAVVLFQGTAQEEWKDNFIGGNVADTKQQENALQWYQEAYKKHGLDQYDVTVTGHSKGGNKSKYITIQDDTVDRCVSFDGQGFSDKFMEKYKDKIAERQSKIENHNVDYDYVNILLNDIGKTNYYKGQNIGDGGGGFLENHHPNSFMKWDESGHFSMEQCPDGQPAEMKAVDEFLNSCLRSLPDEDKDKMLSMIHRFVMFGFSASDSSPEKMWKDIKDIMSDPDTRESLPYLLSYFVQYERANPEMAKLIRDFLNKSGMEEYCKYVDMVSDLLNNGLTLKINAPWGDIPVHISVEDIIAILGGIGDAAVIGNSISNGAITNKIGEKLGLDLSKEDLKILVEMIKKVKTDLDDIRELPDGSDIRIKEKKPSSSHAGSGSYSGRGHQFSVNLEKIGNLLPLLRTIYADLHTYAGDVMNEKQRIVFMTSNTPAIRRAAGEAEKDLMKLEKRVEQLTDSLERIMMLYESTEKKLSS